MKNKYFKPIKYILLLTIMFSCAKEEINVDSNENNEVDKGSIYGTVKLFDRYDKEVFSFDDITIEIIDSDSVSVNINLDSNGKFLTEKYSKGYSYLRIDKPGFVGVKTIRIENTTAVDSLPQIILFEELPFTFVNFSIDHNGKYCSEIDFSPTETFMVSHYICFHTDTEVSINNCMMTTSSGGSTNINYISKNFIRSLRSTNDFLNHGFHLGEVIYAVQYAVIPKFSEFYWQTQDFEIIEIKLNHPSNTAIYILQ